MDPEPDTALTADEQKYFDSQGETRPSETPPVETPPTDGAAPPAEPAKTDGDDQERNNLGQFVRRADLEREQEHRKNLDRALREERQSNAERNARLEERLGFLAQAMQPQPEPIDPNDSSQVLQYTDQRIDRIEQTLQERQEQERQQYEVTSQQQAFTRALEQAEQEFAKEAPDYYDAIEFARTARDKELQVLGYSDPQQRQSIIWNDIWGISNDAFRNRQNPAQVWYNYAKERGYQGKAPAPSNGADQKLRNIAAGQAAGKSLGSAPGTATAQLTLENIANMPEDEFRKIALDRTQWKKLVGG